MARMKLVTGLVKTHAAAENAVQRIIHCGHTREDISLVMTDNTRRQYFSVESGTQAAAGAGVGSAVGGAVGAVVAAIAAVGTTVLLPGFGLVVAGPIAAALVGAGAGSATGGLIGALVGSGIPEHRAHLYQMGLKKGWLVIGVQARSDEDAERLAKVLEDVGAGQIRTENADSLPLDSFV